MITYCSHMHFGRGRAALMKHHKHALLLSWPPLQVKMKEYTNRRVLAANAWTQSEGSIKVATKTFLESCQSMGLKSPRDPAAFIKYWGREWELKQSVDGNASNSGRKPAISDKDAKTCLDVLLNWKDAGLKGPYRSVQHLVSTSSVVRDILHKTNASQRTLTRAMQRMCPELTFKKLTVKAKLTEQHKQQRVAMCEQHLQVSDNTLETVVWIDAKTMYMNITQRYGWVDASKEDVFETKRTSNNKSNILKLKYYIAVNARLGAVQLVFYTGTSGMPAARDGKTYLVSSCNVQVWGATSFNILQRTGDGLLPAVPSGLVICCH